MKARSGPVFWFLSGGPAKASSRLQGYLISREFAKIGVQSVIVYGRENPGGRDFSPFARPNLHVNLRGTTAVIQKLYGLHTDSLIDWLRCCGSTIAYVGCDFRSKNETWKKADIVLATSAALARDYTEQSGSQVRTVFDPFEYSLDPEAVGRSHLGGRLKIVWFGDKSNWYALEGWKRILESDYPDRVELLTVSNHPNATWQWSMEAQRHALGIADIGIVPTGSGPEAQFKSANRLTQLMAMGVPAIVGDLESYREIRDQGLPVSIATNEIGFKRALERLLDSDYRRNVAKDAYQMTMQRFSPEMAARRWMEVLGIEVGAHAALGRLRDMAQAIAVGSILRTIIFASRVRRRLRS
ncbi:MAG: glycosyltransferase [Chromatiaceae bacterium]